MQLDSHVSSHPMGFAAPPQNFGPAPAAAAHPQIGILDGIAIAAAAAALGVLRRCLSWNVSSNYQAAVAALM